MARVPVWLWVVVAAVGCDAGPVRKVGDGEIPVAPTDTSAPQTTGGGGPICDAQDEDGTCTEFLGPQWDDASIANACQGDVLAGRCPTSDLGGCSYEPGGPLATIVWFYSGVYYDTADIPSLSSQCYQTYGSWQ